MKKTTRFIPVRASYDAASRSSEAMRHWRGADSLAADAALSPDVRKIIIDRARYEVANNGYAYGILSTLADDCIGTGPRLQLSLFDMDEAAPEWEKKLERRERRWAHWCRAVGLCQKLKIARRTKAQDGEVFIKKEVNPKIRGMVKLDITLYESEQVGSLLLATKPIEYYDNGVPKEVDGVMFDKDGNPEKYCFWRVHPGASGFCSVACESYEVDAADVIHYANIIRPGQHRGLSEIASTLPIFNDLRRFTNAVLAAAETAAEISFLLQTDLPTTDDDGEATFQHMDPGTIIDFCRNAGISLPEGWKASQLKAEQPTSTHAEFVRTKIREASRALSMPMNVALGDSSGYNYASGRLDFQTYFRMINGERSLIAETVLDNILEAYEEFDKLFFPEDYISDDGTTAPEIDHEWTWDGFAHVDPLKEANAQAVRLNVSRTTTLAEECSAEGKDFMKVLQQKTREEYVESELRKKYNLPPRNTAANSTTKGDDDNAE